MRVVTRRRTSDEDTAFGCWTLRLAVGAVRYDEDTAFGCWRSAVAKFGCFVNFGQFITKFQLEGDNNCLHSAAFIRRAVVSLYVQLTYLKCNIKSGTVSINQC